MKIKESRKSNKVSTHATPSKSARQIVASAQWKNCNSRLNSEIHLIQDRQNPTNGTITSTRQDSQIRHIFVQFQPKYKLKMKTHPHSLFQIQNWSIFV